MKSFAQNFEDVMLWRALNHVVKGFFIDIGAHHPIKDSVSKIFSEAGWAGIHVEPVPLYADLVRKDRPGDQVIEAIVSDKNGLCEFYSIEGTGLSTSRKEIAESHKANNFEYSSIIVSAVTLDDIISLCPSSEIHWLKIDVEGMEKAVLSGWTDTRRLPWVVVIESTYPGTQLSNFSNWEELIVNKGYDCVYSDGLNRFYLQDKHEKLRDAFIFPPNIFDGFQLTPESDHVIEIVRAHEQKIAAMESYISAYAEEQQFRTDEIVAGVRSEASDQLDDALERERTLIENAAAQKQEWEQRYSRLQEQLTAISEKFLVREQDIQSRTDMIISDVRDKAREQLEAARERERVLTHDMATQKEEYGSAVSIMKQSYQDRFDQIQRKIDGKNIHLGKSNEKIKLKNNLIDDLLLVIENQREIFRDIICSRSWRFSSLHRIIFKENYLDYKLFCIENDTRASHIAASNKNSNTMPVPLSDSDGLEDDIKLAVCPESEKSQDHDELKNQGCILDMPSQEVSNIIDLISLPLDQFIIASYNILLERKPDPSELHLHSSALRAGLGRNRIIYEIFSSREYKDRYDSMMMAKSDNDFIGWLYDRYMRRSPDSIGLAHYSNILGGGASRERVKKDIASSREAQSMGGLWIELDRLLEFERQQHKRRRHWLGRYQPSNRQKHQEHEALLQLFHMTGQQRRLPISQVERRQMDQAAGIFNPSDDAVAISNFESNAVEPVLPLAAVDTSDMAPEARRIIVRLQHVKGASLEKGHA